MVVPAFHLWSWFKSLLFHLDSGFLPLRQVFGPLSLVGDLEGVSRSYSVWGMNLKMKNLSLDDCVSVAVPFKQTSLSKEMGCVVPPISQLVSSTLPSARCWVLHLGHLHQWLPCRAAHLTQRFLDHTAVILQCSCASNIPLGQWARAQTPRKTL